MNEQTKICKVIVAGDGGVGKTSIVYKLVGKDIDIDFTTGIDFEEFDIKLDNNFNIDIVFWDLGGQPLFRFFQSDFFDSANIILLVFDLNRYSSFLNIEKEWLPIVDENNLLKTSKLILVGNKMDLGQTIDDKDIKKYVIDNNLPFIKISTKDSKNLNELKNIIIKLANSFYKDN